MNTYAFLFYVLENIIINIFFVVVVLYVIYYLNLSVFYDVLHKYFIAHSVLIMYPRPL